MPLRPPSAIPRMTSTAISSLIRSGSYVVDATAVAAAVVRASHDVLEAGQRHRPAAFAKHEPGLAGRHAAHPGHARRLGA
jgi:hypothetical protein